MSDLMLIQFGAALAAADPSALMLLDSECLSPYTRAFLAAYRPAHVIPVGAFPDGVPEVEARLRFAADPPLGWSDGPPLALWRQSVSTGRTGRRLPRGAAWPAAAGSLSCRNAPRAAIRPRGAGR